MEDQRLQLRELEGPHTDQVACPGMYKACVIMDSCIYQIGKETPKRMLAWAYCEAYGGPIQSVQIFDDKGECHIIDGKLKKIYDDTHDNSFFANTALYITKLTGQTFVEKTELLQLKQHLRKLKEQDPKYRKLCNKVTSIADNAKGKNPIAILNGIAHKLNSL